MKLDPIISEARKGCEFRINPDQFLVGFDDDRHPVVVLRQEFQSVAEKRSYKSPAMVRPIRVILIRRLNPNRKYKKVR